MRGQLRWVVMVAAVSLGLFPTGARAQSGGDTLSPPPPPPSTYPEPQPVPQDLNAPPSSEPNPYPVQTAPAPVDAAPPMPRTTDVPPPSVRATPEGYVPIAPPNPNGMASPESGPVIDGHLRSGPFLSGPGSALFIAHHTLLGAAGGLVTQGFGTRWKLDTSSREAILIGALVGGGIGFGISAWWQFNHWISYSTANFSVVNSLIGAMAFVGLFHLFSNDPTLLAWTGVLGAELGAWLTTIVGGGDLPVNDGLLVASGGLWGLVYGALIASIVNFAGTPSGNVNNFINPVLIGSGVGAGLMALATLRYHASASQILRADGFGAGVGAAVLLLSGIVIGNFRTPVPYVLGLVSSVGAIAAVSIFWEESAERPQRYGLIQMHKQGEPYLCSWW